MTTMVAEYTWGGDVKRGGAWLRRLRESQGLTQRELEKRTGGRVSFTIISQLEIGAVSKPSMGALVALGEALGVTPEEVAAAFGYYHPRKQGNEPEQLIYLKRVLERASVGQRVSLLRSVEALARVTEQTMEE